MTKRITIEVDDDTHAVLVKQAEAAQAGSPGLTPGQVQSAISSR